jgi:putative FmdB family regulatory protein
MPTYEYVCDACDHAFELFQQMRDPVKRKCPKCGRPKLRRLVGTGAGIIFRGSGFYETDYRSESYKKAAESEKSAASGGDAKPAGVTTDAKTADAKTADAKTADAKTADAKTADAKTKDGATARSESAPPPARERATRSPKKPAKKGARKKMG